MYGRITKFDHRTGIGIISTDEGDRYRFVQAEITNGGCPLLGQSVDFLVYTRSAKDIIVMAGSPWSVFGSSAAHASHRRAGA